MSTMPFTHLHCHSHYSLLDGAGTIPGLINRAKELGMSALALTDHGKPARRPELLQDREGRGHQSGRGTGGLYRSPAVASTRSRPAARRRPATTSRSWPRTAPGSKTC